jgi:hypothetical protein
MSSFNDTPIGPSDGTPTVIAVTNSSVHVNLTSSTYATLAKAIRMKKTLVMKAEGDVYYRWSSATSGGTVDETMAASGGTPANQCGILFVGEPWSEKAPLGTKGIIIKTNVAAGCKLRIWES